ncbi:hypothetical protein BGW80DRAFT_1174838, partial [Lactifluus volemus]
SRFVKWPDSEYIHLQRQKVIHSQRLKVPPAIAQFSHTVDENIASQLVKLPSTARDQAGDRSSSPSPAWSRGGTT